MAQGVSRNPSQFGPKYEIGIWHHTVRSGKFPQDYLVSDGESLEYGVDQPQNSPYPMSYCKLTRTRSYDYVTRQSLSPLVCGDASS